MALSYATTVIDAPADAVWARVRDFNGLPDWNPEVIATSEIEDGKAGDQVGAVRSFTLGGRHEPPREAAGALRREAVVHLRLPEDAVRRRQLLRDDPRHAGHRRRTRRFVEWWTTFDCDRDQQEHWTGFFANEIFKNGFDAMKKRIRGE